MWTFLVIAVFITASGYTESSVSDQNGTMQGIVGQNVLLPCSCPKKDENTLMWQIEETQTIICEEGNINKSCKGRVKLFLTEDKDNCSLLLSNISMADKGKYRCAYCTNKVFVYDFVDLQVADNPEVPGEPGGRKETSTTAAVSSSVIFVVLLLVLFGGILVMYWRQGKKRRRHLPEESPAEENMSLNSSDNV